MADDAKQPDPAPPQALDYAEPPAVPGHVEDLLKLNRGCAIIAIFYVGIPLGGMAYTGLRDGVPPWRWWPTDALWALTCPGSMLAIWLLAPLVRRFAARQQRERWELRPSEVLAEGELLDKQSSANRRFAGTIRVRFRVEGTVITGTKPAGSRAFHRYHVGETVPVAVDPRNRKRWRLLEPPPESRTPDF